jgi:hypothetical protein
MDGLRGLVSVEEEEESLQAMPGTSALQMSGSNTKIDGKRGLVSVEEEESLQAMPGKSALQMSGSNTKIDGKRGLVSVEEEEESLQTMPGEVIQQ